MKKIIIVSDSLRVGGIQQALINFLNTIDYDKFQVNLFLFHYDKSYDFLINDKVQLIHSSNLLNIASSTANEAKKKGIFYLAIRKMVAILCYIFGSNLIFNFLFKFEKRRTYYDYAISFSNNINNKSVYFGQNKFVIEKVEAKKKYTWLHVDYNEMKLKNEINKREYEQFDRIICVSKAVKNVFIENYPKLVSKCRVMYNYVDDVKIKKMSNEYVLEHKSSLNIVSVGRLDKNKSPLSYITAAQVIKQQGIDFHWWIIGSGPQYKMIESLIKQNDLENFITLTGQLENPYPYIKHADLFVSASLSESFGMAIVEALCLNTPVITKYFPAVTEYLCNNHNGLIVYGDNSDLINAILSMINKPEMYRQIKKNTTYNISKHDIICQFERIIYEDE